MSLKWMVLTLTLASVLMTSCGPKDTNPTKDYKHLNDTFGPEHGIKTPDQKIPAPVIQLVPMSSSNLTTIGTTMFEVDKENQVDLMAEVLDFGVDKIDLKLVPTEDNANYLEEISLRAADIPNNESGNKRVFVLSWKPSHKILGAKNWKSIEIPIRFVLTASDNSDLSYLSGHEMNKSLNLVVIIPQTGSLGAGGNQ